MEDEPWHAIGAPLLQVHNISVHLDDDIEYDEELNLYGEIIVIDGLKKEFPIYECEESNPDFLEIDGDLVLADTEPVMAPFPSTVFKVCIKDKAQGDLVLLKGSIQIDFDKDIAIAQKFDERYLIGNNGWSLSVRYTLFTTAVLAYIKIAPYKLPKQTDDVHGDYYDGHGTSTFSGTISMSAESPFKICDDYQSVLLNTRVPEPITFGSPIYLKRQAFAVPAFGSLYVRVRLRGGVEGDEKVVKMDARDVGTARQCIDFQDYQLRVFVKWRHGHPKNMEPLNTSKVSREQDPNCQLIYRQPLTWIHCLEELTEVFSVCFVLDKGGCYMNDVCRLYGTMKFNGALLEKCNILEGDSAHPQTLTGETNFLVIRGPPERAIAGPVMSLVLDMKDTNGRQLCRGIIGYNDVTVEHWFDRPICSIIKGEYGWAEVYYCIFKRAVQATVSISFSFPSSSRKLETSVCGSIIARYSNVTFGTMYEKERFRSVLFSKPKQESVTFTIGRRMPLKLTKSIVAVPKGSTLVIEVQLDSWSEPHAVEPQLTLEQLIFFRSPEGIEKFEELWPRTEIASVGKTDLDALRGVMEFEIGRECCQRISGENFYLDVCVDWHNVVHRGKDASNPTRFGSLNV